MVDIEMAKLENWPMVRANFGSTAGAALGPTAESAAVARAETAAGVGPLGCCKLSTCGC